MASKPVQRSIAELKKRGYTCHVVERWNSFAKIRQDFGGFADILAYKPGEVGVLAIQACADSGDVSKHVKKLLGVANLGVWLQSGNKCEIWGWGMRGERGKRKTWTLRAINMTAGQFLATEKLEYKASLPDEQDAALPVI